MKKAIKQTIKKFSMFNKDASTSTKDILENYLISMIYTII